MQHPIKGRRRRRPQKSPFFDLPPEVRSRVYRAALVNPTPIDLCPLRYAQRRHDIDRDASMHQRYYKYMTSNCPPRDGSSWHLNRSVKVAFRIQNSLRDVRTGLVVQILAVCCQIYNEAAPYFWTRNTWRFSYDLDWEYVLRFLLTIGPNARSMLQEIEIIVPHTIPRPTADNLPQILPREKNWRVKNHPKLHMVKCSYKYGECYNAVWNIWMQERSLQRLKLVVPRQWKIGYAYDSWISDEVSMHFLAKTQVILERGSLLMNRGEMLQLGWDVIAKQGSTTAEEWDHSVTKHEEEVIYRSVLDYLTGVPQLFQIEEDSIHANGGRAKPLRNKRRVCRQLHAFGPCMVVVERVPCRCPCCQKCSHRPNGHECPDNIRYTSLVDAQEDKSPE